MSEHSGEYAPPLMWPQVPYMYANKYVFHCDCVGEGHYIEVIWDEDDDEFRYLWISEGWRPRSWRERVVAVWRLARGRSVIGCGVMLDEVNTAALQRVLAKHHPIVSTNGTTWTTTFPATVSGRTEASDA